MKYDVDRLPRRELAVAKSSGYGHGKSRFYAARASIGIAEDIASSEGLVNKVVRLAILEAAAARHAQRMHICFSHVKDDSTQERPRRFASEAEGASGYGRCVSFGLPAARGPACCGAADARRSTTAACSSELHRSSDASGQSGPGRARATVIVFDASAAIELLLNTPVAPRVQRACFCGGRTASRPSPPRSRSSPGFTQIRGGRRVGCRPRTGSTGRSRGLAAYPLSPRPVPLSSMGTAPQCRRLRCRLSGARRSACGSSADLRLRIRLNSRTPRLGIVL